MQTTEFEQPHLVSQLHESNWLCSYPRTIRFSDQDLPWTGPWQEKGDETDRRWLLDKCFNFTPDCWHFSCLKAWIVVLSMLKKYHNSCLQSPINDFLKTYESSWYLLFDWSIGRRVDFSFYSSRQVPKLNVRINLGSQINLWSSP